MVPTGILVVQALSSVIIALALIVLIVGAGRMYWRSKKTREKLAQLLDRVHGELTPLSRQLTAIAGDIHVITSSVRTEVEKVNATISLANDRLKQAVSATEARLQDFHALLAVIQDEAEQLFVSTASTVHGVRHGAATLGERGGTDLASDELDADELENGPTRDSEVQLASEEEEPDGDDGSPQPATEALPTAPRIGPRARHRRHA
jgi:uncharacterized protein YoxC